MAALIGKLAPAAIVAAVVAWCCWPYLNPAKPFTGGQGSDDLPNVADLLLRPALASASGRDPFRPLHVPEPAAAQVDLVSIEEPATPDPVPEEPVDVLGRLRLDATFIDGDRRLALINGRICAQGESLPVFDAAVDPCTVAQIFADNVLIQHRGQTLELKYRNPLSMAGPSGATEAAEPSSSESKQTTVSESDVP